jgi:hypothetical protein
VICTTQSVSQSGLFAEHDSRKWTAKETEGNGSVRTSHVVMVQTRKVTRPYPEGDGHGLVTNDGQSQSVTRPEIPMAPGQRPGAGVARGGVEAPPPAAPPPRRRPRDFASRGSGVRIPSAPPDAPFKVAGQGSFPGGSGKGPLIIRPWIRLVSCGCGVVVWVGLGGRGVA